MAQAICELKDLAHLDLSVGNFKSKKFAGFRKLENLGTLNLKLTGSVDDLSALTLLPKLRSINMSAHTYDTGLWEFISDCPTLRSFEILVGVSDDRLADWVSKNKSLRSLSLGQDVFMTDVGARKLAECDQLEWIAIGGDISKEAVLSLARLPNLNYLSVWSDLVTEAEQVEIKGALSHLRIDIREHYPSIGKAKLGDDGFFRSKPKEGRKNLDALEGQSLESMLEDSLEPELEKELQGQVVLVEFWGTWCGPCLAMRPEYQRIHDLYHEKVSRYWRFIQKLNKKSVPNT